MAPPDAEREWTAPYRVDLRAVLGPMRRGTFDPTWRTDDSGALWRTTRAPSGPATLRLGVRRADGVVVAAAWGPGADWAVESLPDLLGVRDDVGGFEPQHPVVAHAWRRWSHWRVPRSGRVMEALVPAVLEQKVTGLEARRSWRELLTRFGDPAPGPAPPGMRVPPDGAAWARIPSWEWHLAGVDGKRAATVVAASRVAARMEEAADLPAVQARARLAAVPGVGAWTVAEVAQRALGDPDTVSVGDYHLAGVVGTALTGEKVDDARMLELLEGYRGHRYRAVRMIELSGAGAVERHGPRFAGRDNRRI